MPIPKTGSTAGGGGGGGGGGTSKSEEVAVDAIRVEQRVNINSWKQTK